MGTLFSRAFPVSFIFVQWLCSVWYHWLIISFTHCRLNCVIVDKSEVKLSFLTLVCDLFFFSPNTWRTLHLSTKFLTRMYLDVTHPIPSIPQASYISKFKFHYKCSLRGKPILVLCILIGVPFITMLACTCLSLVSINLHLLMYSLCFYVLSLKFSQALLWYKLVCRHVYLFGIIIFQC